MWSELLHEFLRQIVFKDVLKGISLNEKNQKRKKREDTLMSSGNTMPGPHFEL